MRMERWGRRVCRVCVSCACVCWTKRNCWGGGGNAEMRTRFCNKHLIECKMDCTYEDELSPFSTSLLTLTRAYSDIVDWDGGVAESSGKLARSRRQHGSRTNLSWELMMFVYVFYWSNRRLFAVCTEMPAILIELVPLLLFRRGNGLLCHKNYSIIHSFA